MCRSVLSPPVANIPDFDAKLLSDLAGRLAAVTPMVHYRTLKLFGITFPRFAPFGATVLVHNSLVSDPRNRVQFFGGRAHIERSFAHILDCAGMRRATLRGWENLNKRFKLAAAFYNLSQLMRKLFGVGTPKQLAALARALFSLLGDLLSLTAAVATSLAAQLRLKSSTALG